jgi:hypothetical protein
LSRAAMASVTALAADAHYLGLKRMKLTLAS